MQHTSDCATNNGPAFPAGPCDCGGALPAPIARADRIVELERALEIVLSVRVLDNLNAEQWAAVQAARRK